MTFEWESFYADGDFDRGAYVGGDDMADHLDAFLEHVAPVDSILSVGCGPAAAEFDVATRRPDVDVHCVDISESVVDANRGKARSEAVANLTFAVDGLPELDVDGEFDVVYCMAVLYFVADAERALEDLWSLTAPGGALAFTYPTTALQEWAQALEDDDHDKREAFSLVADGENLLTADAVERVLGVPPENYWTAVGADLEADYVQRDGSPAVYVQKPVDAS